MKTLSKFWNTFSKSIISPEYYREILKKPLGSSFKFYFAYFFFYAVILTIILSVTIYWPLQGFFNVLPGEIKEVYPEELVITIEDGEASTNVEEPYYIPFSALDGIIEEFDERVLGASTDEVHNLVVIDTNASIENIYDYQTVILLTETHLVFIDDGTLEATPLSDVGNLTIDKQGFNSVVNFVSPYMNIILPVAIIVTFISLALFLPLINMSYLAIYSLIILLLATMLSLSVNYKKSYQLGLHLIIMPTTLFFILSHIFNLHVNFSFAFTIVLTLWTLFVLLKMKDETKTLASPTVEN